MDPSYDSSEEETLKGRRSFDMAGSGAKAKAPSGVGAHRKKRQERARRVLPVSSSAAAVANVTRPDLKSMPVVPADKLVISINDTRVVFWDVFVLLMLLYQTWAVPFNIGVSGGHLWKYMGIGGLMLSESVNVVFICDTIVYFFRETRDDDGQLVWRLRDIASRYARGWFLADLISCTPVDTIAYVSKTENGSTLAHILMVLQTLKLLRLSRISRRLKGSPSLQKFSLRLSMVPMQIAYIFLVSVYVAHCMACVWCFTSNLEDGKTWMEKFLAEQSTELQPNGDEFSNIMDMYVLALYWASVTLVSLGYGDVTPYTRAEYWVCATCILVSAFLWAWVVASMVDLVGKVQQAENELNSHLAVMNRFSDEQKPMEKSQRSEWYSLMDEARLYLQTTHEQRRRQQSSAKINETLQVLSPSLRLRIELARAENTLLKLRCFRHCRVTTLAFLVGNMVEVSLACGEVIVDDDADILGRERGLYFLTSGTCFSSARVKTANDEKGTLKLVEALHRRIIQGDVTIDRDYTASTMKQSQLKMVSAGDIWDFDRFLFDRSSPIFCPARLFAVTYCELVMLPRKAFFEALELDPSLRWAVRQRIARVALGDWAKRVHAGELANEGVHNNGFDI